MLQDERSKAEQLVGLLGIDGYMQQELANNPPPAIKQAPQQAPMSLMDQMDERKGKFKNRLGLFGHIMSGGKESTYGDADLLAQQKTMQTQQALQDKMGMAQPYIDMLQDGNQSTNLAGMFGLNQMGFDQDMLEMAIPGMATQKPSEFYAGDLIYDEERGQYGQIMLDKHGGESTTKWYEAGQIPKEAMMSRESFDSAYNSALESRGTARGNLGQTTRAMDQISSVSDEEWTAGLAGDVETWWKDKITGGTDKEQWAKKSAINVRNLQQMGMLPPGPATDRDVDLVMKGAPGDQASKQEWMEYLNAAQRLNEKAVYHQTERLNWMDERGLRGMQGFNKHWETVDPYKEKAAPAQGGASSMPEGLGIDQSVWDAMSDEDRALWN